MRSAFLMLGVLLAGAAGASRIEYRVQSGDTAYSIARRHGLTVEALLSQNRLASSNLSLGQALVIESPVAASPPASAPAVHVVAAGDTAYSIAKRYGVTTALLLGANGLTTPDLKVGQTLQLPPPPAQAVQTVQPPPAPRPALSIVTPGAPLRDVALSFVNVPYRLGGNSPAGLDCSGLVLQVFTPLGVTLPRRSEEQYRVGVSIDRSELREGDLVFFDIEGAGVVTHVGIALDREQFVHANTYLGYVSVSALSEPYYAQRYLGARRVLPVMASH